MLTARNTDLNDKLYFPPVQTRAKRLGFFIRKDEKNKRTYKEGSSVCAWPGINAAEGTASLSRYFMTRSKDGGNV